jgi:hypothetical protein
MVKKKGKKDRAYRMHQPYRTTEKKKSQSTHPSDTEDRRSHNREEGVISQIEDITYKVLRQHDPKKS